MPIRIKCQCGKALAVKDELAGKAVKCPGCSQPIRVPAGSQLSASVKAPQPSEAQLPALAGTASLADLFDEEGFTQQVAAVCPSCKAQMTAAAILCTKCGFNKQTGQMLSAHLTPGVDISQGTLALQAASGSMAKEVRLQQEMIKKAGLPWWGLALILFIGGSAVVIGTLAVNAARRVDETMQFNPRVMFLQLSGGACLVVAAGALLSLIVVAFRKSRKDGLLMFTVIYIFMFVFKNFRETWKTFLTVLIVGSIGGVLLSMAAG